MVLDLEVRRFLDLEALDHGLEVFSFRIWTRAHFKHTTGSWTPVVPALIDTGAPFSVVPSPLWHDLDVQGGFATQLRGLVQRPSAVLKARFAQLTCRLSDLKSTTPPLTFWALLAEGEVPLVLGCAGVLDRATLLLDARHNRARLELETS